MVCQRWTLNNVTIEIANLIRHRFIFVKNATIYYIPRLTKDAMTWCMHVEYANMMKKSKTNVFTGTIFWLLPSMLGLATVDSWAETCGREQVGVTTDLGGDATLVWNPLHSILFWMLRHLLQRPTPILCAQVAVMMSKLVSSTLFNFGWHLNPALCSTRTNQNGRRLGWSYSSFAQNVITVSRIHHYHRKVFHDRMMEPGWS